MEYGTVEKISGDRLEITADEETDLRKINRLSDGKKPRVMFQIDDGRTISADQRKKIYALINDLCDFTGDVPEYWKAKFKFMVQMIFGVEEFSLSDCSMTTANRMILTILDFLFEEDIPFKTKTWDSIPNDFPKQMLCIKNKRCVICGKKADIAHYQAVGSGRNRRTINHVGMYINTFCREHHTQQHELGINNFSELYHIKPIKVTEEIARELHLGRITK